MSGPQSTRRRSTQWSIVWITVVLAVGAGSLIPWVGMAVQPDDTEAIESPLLLSIVHQLESGPRELYGPYGGRYPVVLIHAPLYYRLAALVAWLLARAGVDQVTAALAAGRMLSVIGFVAAIVAAYRLARLGGLPARAGWWAGLLVAATPICRGLPVEVRPDMLGIGLQTMGILLFLSALRMIPIGEAKLMAAFGCFATALCIKQHFVVAPLVSTLILVVGWARGRVGLAAIPRCLSIALAVIVLYYGTEEWITGGRMSRSVLIAAGNVGRIHPASWSAPPLFLLALVWKCAGAILLIAAAGLAMASARPGLARLAFAFAGTILVGIVVALELVQLRLVELWLSRSIVLGLFAVIALIIPASAWLERSLLGDRLDWVLWVYCGAEMALTVVLWRLSTGGWYNYAVQAVVIACVLTARALTRACDKARSWRPLLPAALAVLAVPAFAFTDVKQVLLKRETDAAVLARLRRYCKRPAAEIFVVDLPGANRIHGRLDLVYDPWLYPVFESIGLAEPRSLWLEQALATGPVHVVATISRDAGIDGLKRTLPQLGYSLSGRVGSYHVWVRQAAATR